MESRTHKQSGEQVPAGDTIRRGCRLHQHRDLIKDPLLEVAMLGGNGQSLVPLPLTGPPCP